MIQSVGKMLAKIDFSSNADFLHHSPFYTSLFLVVACPFSSEFHLFFIHSLPYFFYKFIKSSIFMDLAPDDVHRLLMDLLDLKRITNLFRNKWHRFSPIINEFSTQQFSWQLIVWNLSLVPQKKNDIFVNFSFNSFNIDRI